MAPVPTSKYVSGGTGGVSEYHAQAFEGLQFCAALQGKARDAYHTAGLEAMAEVVRESWTYVEEGMTDPSKPYLFVLKCAHCMLLCHFTLHTIVLPPADWWYVRACRYGLEGVPHSDKYLDAQLWMHPTQKWDAGRYTFVDGVFERCKGGKRTATKYYQNATFTWNFVMNFDLGVEPGQKSPTRDIADIFYDPPVGSHLAKLLDRECAAFSLSDGTPFFTWFNYLTQESNENAALSTKG